MQCPPLHLVATVYMALACALCHRMACIAFHLRSSNLDWVDVFQALRIEEGEEYEVQQIHGKKEVDGVTKYLVEWKASHGRKYWKKTWEPVSGLANAAEKIQEYNNRNRNAPNTSSKKRARNYEEDDY